MTMRRVNPNASTGGGGGDLPTPTRVGQVLYSDDGLTFEVRTPVVSTTHGWMTNDKGLLLVK